MHAVNRPFLRLLRLLRFLRFRFARTLCSAQSAPPADVQFARRDLPQGGAAAPELLPDGVGSFFEFFACIFGNICYTIHRGIVAVAKVLRL